MKEIKAFIHRNRISDVVHELKQTGYKYISVVDVLGLLKALDSQEQQYSVEIGDKVVAEVKLELVCDNEKLNQAIEIIVENARTGQKTAGWIYVTDIERTIMIDGS
ncbi:P-II family nitrogen regulator [Kordiimonas aquimaris]|uniref:P-II family nitrogen regulator n=1 Tax=Kordiimonas aquimaris TaxID=707591 RepID=UPI0021D1BDFF|nr:P-II family nitrogen regulator [Kordiimonas aquimaris]